MIEAAFLNWTVQQFQAFILILVRVAGIIFMMPVLSAKGVPNITKIGLCLLVSLILLPLVHIAPAIATENILSLAILLVKELLLGFVLGLLLKLVFTGIQIAGQMMGFQMGFGVASVMDPQLGQETPLLSEIGYLVSLLIFLAIDGHHMFFKTLVYSFQVLQPGQISITVGTYERVLAASGGMFTIAVKTMAPVTAILLFIQVSLGILAKAVPQMNILAVSFPLTICVGLFFFGLSLQVMGPFFISAMQDGMNLLPVMIREFRG